ncbi:fasciclin-like arabinogalactan protein 21 [Mercurialis annua]|uniref:fasciclin-like arabinogalactan protein 21 n=1 Tax=Mercurialis annua TaxID=3986 RepID=UPI00216025F2|nr:fasciclin-like arabinogalactan protein 21 [Mercurialis annua]
MATSFLCFSALIAIFSLFHATAALKTTVTATASTLSPLSQPPLTSSQSPLSSTSQDLHENAFFSHAALLGPILSHLGYNELATAAPSLSVDISSTSSWSGPSTLFAASDSSLHTCASCSVQNLLREHIVPGLYTINYLRKLVFGTKIETLSPGRCLTVTSTSFQTGNSSNTSSVVKVFIGGVEITHPDLFNNGLIVIHGIQGYVAPLSPFSCDVERLNSLTFPFHSNNNNNNQPPPQQMQTDHFPRNLNQPLLPQPAIMRLMIRDAMLRLRNNGFSVLSLAMRVKYAELVTLTNMTMFALDDASIFSGSHSYISSIRFHIVPNMYLTFAELEKLPIGTTLHTLERGQSLVVTSSGIGSFTPAVVAFPMRINYVRVKVPDLIRNLKIVVHSVYLPFPRIDPVAAAFDGMLGMQSDGGGTVDQAAATAVPVGSGSCAAVNMDENGNCTTGAPIPSFDQQFKTTVDLDEYHGL